MNREYLTTTTQRRPVLRSSVPNIVLGVALQVARKFLFIDPKKKAVIVLTYVVLLSVVGSFITFDDSVYIIQKHSVFNKYGVKLGWLWTCVIVGPFIWFSSRAHHREKDKSIADIMRLVLATVFWKASVWQFQNFLHMTSRCNLSLRYSRAQCEEKGGVWIPGFDISGHCFLMIYSMLVMAEEAHAFREWNQVVHRDDDSGLLMREKQERRVRLTQYFVVGMLLLNLLWIKQLTISVLYYHIMIDKIAGALVAMFWWYFTYHVLYPSGILRPPIHRKKPTPTIRR